MSVQDNYLKTTDGYFARLSRGWTRSKR